MISVSEARRHNICSNTEEVEHLKWEGCGWASKNVYDLNRSVSPFYYMVKFKKIKQSQFLFLSRNVISKHY